MEHKPNLPLTDQSSQNNKLDTMIFGDYVEVRRGNRAEAEEIVNEQISCRVPDTHRDNVKVEYHMIPYVGLVYITWTYYPGPDTVKGRVEKLMFPEDKTW